MVPPGFTETFPLAKVNFRAGVERYERKSVNGTGAVTTNRSRVEAGAPSRCSFATPISGANAYVVEAVGHTRASMAEWRTG